jgi:hypothetical protein
MPLQGGSLLEALSLPEVSSFQEASPLPMLCWQDQAQEQLEQSGSGSSRAERGIRVETTSHFRHAPTSNASGAGSSGSEGRHLAGKKLEFEATEKNQKENQQTY